MNDKLKRLKIIHHRVHRAHREENFLGRKTRQEILGKEMQEILDTN